MEGFTDRLLNSRKSKGFSQQDLAKMADVHFTNVGKYERGEAIPSADVLNRIAKALEVSADYLLNGTVNEQASISLLDADLLQQFKKVEQLPERKKELVKEFLDAFLLKSNLKDLLM